MLNFFTLLCFFLSILYPGVQPQLFFMHQDPLIFCFAIWLHPLPVWLSFTWWFSLWRWHRHLWETDSVLFRTLNLLSLFSLNSHFDYMGSKFCWLIPLLYLSKKFTLLLFALLWQLVDRTSLILLFYPSPYIFSFRRTSTKIIPFGTQEVHEILARKKYLMGSLPITSFASITLALLLFFTIFPHSMHSLLFSLLYLLPSPAPGTYYRTWVFITTHFFQLLLFFHSSAAKGVLFISIFRKHLVILR